MTENQSAEYPEVRELTRKDRKKLSELIKDFAEKSGNEKLTSMLPGASGKESEGGDDSNDQAYELIKSVMHGLIEWVEDDVTKWFMDLIGIDNREAYDNLPFDIEVHIIDQLIAQKGFNNFFTRASALYKKIRG